MLLFGRGDGSFDSEVRLGAQANTVYVAVADFDSDGKDDIAASNFNSESVSIFLSNGDRTFKDPVHYHCGANPYGIAVGEGN